VIGNLIIVEFSGNFISYHLFHWMSLHLGLKCLLLGILLGLFLLLVVGSVYQVVIYSLHFRFFLSKIQKQIAHFALWYLIFWVLIIDLDTYGKIAYY
jgi:hypothetical protein